MEDDDTYVIFTRVYSYAVDRYCSILYRPGHVQVDDLCAALAVEAGAAVYADEFGRVLEIVDEKDDEGDD